MKAKIFLVGTVWWLVSCASTISGSLKSSTPNEVMDFSNARINISRIDKSDLASDNHIVEVDLDGNFESTAELEKGRYLVEALVPGFTAESKTIVLSSSQEIHFKVTKEKEDPTGTIGANLDVELGKGAGGATLMPPNL